MTEWNLTDWHEAATVVLDRVLRYSISISDAFLLLAEKKKDFANY